MPLQEQPFQVLVLLLHHVGEVVTREKLQHTLWPSDTFVEFEQGVNTAIKKLRPSPSVSPDGRSLLYAMRKVRGNDLMLVENFR